VNITLSLDPKVVARIRRLAAQRGTSLNQMVRDYLAQLAGDAPADELIRRLDKLWAADEGDSRGWRYKRVDLHDRPVFRRH
jgi:hypothetical protein